jgi:hypothetical protein
VTGDRCVQVVTDTCTPLSPSPSPSPSQSLTQSQQPTTVLHYTTRASSVSDTLSALDLCTFSTRLVHFQHPTCARSAPDLCAYRQVAPSVRPAYQHVLPCLSACSALPISMFCPAYQHVLPCLSACSALPISMFCPAYQHVLPCLSACSALPISMFCPAYQHVLPCLSACSALPMTHWLLLCEEMA